MREVACPATPSPQRTPAPAPPPPQVPRWPPAPPPGGAGNSRPGRRQWRPQARRRRAGPAPPGPRPQASRPRKRQAAPAPAARSAVRNRCGPPSPPPRTGTDIPAGVSPSTAPTRGRCGGCARVRCHWHEVARALQAGSATRSGARDCRDRPHCPRSGPASGRDGTRKARNPQWARERPRAPSTPSAPGRPRSGSRAWPCHRTQDGRRPAGSGCARRHSPSPAGGGAGAG